MEGHCVLVFGLFIGVSITILGLVFIFKKDIAWQIQEWSLRIVRPQRTPEWETSATIRGVIMFVSGLGLLLTILYLAFQ